LASIIIVMISSVKGKYVGAEPTLPAIYAVEA
jgi:hypothetical protein